jgi:hypothetical protein
VPRPGRPHALLALPPSARTATSTARSAW